MTVDHVTPSPTETPSEQLAEHQPVPVGDGAVPAAPIRLAAVWKDAGLGRLRAITERFLACSVAWETSTIGS